MRTSTRLAAFAVATLVAFGAAFGAGRAVGPIGHREPDHPAHVTPSGPTTTTHPAGHPGGQP